MVKLKKNVKSLIGYYLFLRFKIKINRLIKTTDYAFFFPYYHLGGAEQVHLDILKSISDKNSVVFFTHASATKHYYDRFKACATIIELNPILNKKNKRLRLYLFQTIASAINASKVSHVFGVNTKYYYEFLPLVSARKKRIDLIHAIPPDSPDKHMLAHASKYLNNRIVINHTAQVRLSEIYDAFSISDAYKEKISIIRNGVQIPIADKIRKKGQSSKLKVGYVGRWSEEKRPELFLKIASAMQCENEFIFKMAGSGMHHRKVFIESRGVEYLGAFKSKNEMTDLYNSLDILIICSSTEGFPMTLMECMTYGVVPICTNVGGISEHITHNSNGLLIENNSEDTILKAFIMSLLSIKKDIDSFKRLSRNALDYAHKHFNIKSFNKAYRNVLS